MTSTNVVAMPAVSVWVMPAGIFGLMSMPLGRLQRI
jgi:hypothetical protein